MEVTPTNETSRSQKAFKNLFFSLATQVITLILTFINRSIFVKILGIEYLGISGLFTDILNVLSFMELGIGNAIIFSMYAPMAANDTKKLSALMNFYKRAYYIIGFSIAVIGVLIIPFLSFFIKDVPNIDESITVIYLFYLFNIVISYFYVYKSAIINADQKNYIISIQNQIFKIVQCIGQIIFLLITHEFLIYLGIQVICTFLTNYSISKKADNMYPYLKENKYEVVEESEKKSIIEDVKSLFVYKIGDAALNSTDSILISALVNITSVGLMSNYLFIINNLRHIICQGLSAITSTVGNLNATGDIERQEAVLNQLLLIVTWIFGFLSIGYIFAINDLISIWLDKQYTLSNLEVFAIVLQFYLMALEFPAYTYRITMGLFVQGKYASLAGAILNIILSIIFAKFWGLAGVFFATSVARLATLCWIDPYLIYKKRFGKSVFYYFKKWTFYNILLIVEYFIIKNILGFIHLSGISGFCIKVVVITLVFNLIHILFLFKTDDFKNLLVRIKNIFRKKS